MSAPFAPGSVSMRIYPHNDLPATEIVGELCDQAGLAAEHGFDGVMTAEHHGGFAGYLPNPVQAAGWMLESMATGWAAPCPLLLTLPPPAMVAEGIAWLAARFPGRVGLGVASGARKDDFDAMGASMAGLTARFAAALETVAAMLGGRDGGMIADDPAIARCVEHPVPVLSAAMGFTAVRRAAANDVGLLFDSLSAADRVRSLVDAYRAAGGSRPSVLIRRVWLGSPPRDLVDQQLDVYRSYSPRSAQAHWEGDQLVGADDPSAIVDGLADALARTGTDALNLRVHVPGVSPSAARDQIAALGRDVLPALRERLR
jgi:alkanesulfonate monooxygenase SsuD/methylene tetrahydromethanopterin reductase-like flavin-dependent oxidoreductase (luciferase family)